MKSFSVLFLIYLLKCSTLAENNMDSISIQTEAPPKTNSKTCQCVSGHLCSGAEIVKGNEALCQDKEVCCKHLQKEGSTPLPISPTSIVCGLRRPQGVGISLSIDEGEAAFGEFPWMVAILRRAINERSSKIINVYQCGASLIHPQVVLTAAHCVSEKDSMYRIRAGEWDAQSKLELFAHQDRDVKTVIIHPGYQADTRINDVAVLILEAPVGIAENVDVVCLPQQNTTVGGIGGTGCFTSGWGKYNLDKGERYGPTLQKLEMSIVPQSTCRDRLNLANPGQIFEPHNSFVCAGNHLKKYICDGDEGSPLVCPVPGLRQTYFQAGIVAYGVGCSKHNSLGVYANVATFADWIDEQVARNYFNTSSYKY